ncbi:FecR family protein [Pectobacterium araliae]
MKPISDDNDKESADTQALFWLVRLTSGDVTQAELAEFEHWRKADPANECALSEARQLWLQLRQPLETNYTPVLSPDPVSVPVNVLLPTSMSWYRRPVVSAAMALVLMVGCAQYWATHWHYDEMTATGEQRTLALQDGSTMWLNTDSAADIQVSTDKRFIRLAKGDVFFDVAHDPQHPFIVDAGISQIKVLGTAFGVQRRGDSVVVTVERGKVQVSADDASSVVILPDQQVRVDNDEGIKLTTTVNAQRELAWHKGRLVFENQPLGNIIDTLKRYDKRLLVIDAASLRKQRLNAIIDLSNLDEWYDTLHHSLAIRIIKIGPIVWFRESR